MFPVPLPFIKRKKPQNNESEYFCYALFRAQTQNYLSYYFTGIKALSENPNRSDKHISLSKGASDERKWKESFHPNPCQLKQDMVIKLLLSFPL